MKKDKIFIVLLVLLIISSLLLWISFISHINNKVIVVIEEKTPNLISEPLENICPILCEERGYDGWLTTGGTANQETICDCYHKTLLRTEKRLEYYKSVS